MKKIFCDVCGDQMKYGDILPHLKGDEVNVTVNGTNNTRLTFTVQAVVKPIYSTAFASDYSKQEHIDICNDCRLHLLDKLDTRPTVV